MLLCNVLNDSFFDSLDYSIVNMTVVVIVIDNYGPSCQIGWTPMPGWPC